MIDGAGTSAGFRAGGYAHVDGIVFAVLFHEGGRLGGGHGIWIGGTEVRGFFF
jgi:hypothetical protein